MSIDYIDPEERTALSTEGFIAKIFEFTAQVLGDPARDPAKVLRIRGPRPENLSSREAHSLEVIFENLLENASAHDALRWPIKVSFKHGPLGEQRLDISYEPPQRMLLQSDTDRVSIAPRWDPNDRTYHLGMFLVGVHVRLLGGVIWVDQSPSSPVGAVSFRYRIQIPLGAAPGAIQIPE
jgi:hypothetical protein